jgi:hypothetical protein
MRRTACVTFPLDTERGLVYARYNGSQFTHHARQRPFAWSELVFGHLCGCLYRVLPGASKWRCSAAQLYLRLPRQRFLRRAFELLTAGLPLSRDHSQCLAHKPSQAPISRWNLGELRFVAFLTNVLADIDLVAGV